MHIEQRTNSNSGIGAQPVNAKAGITTVFLTVDNTVRGVNASELCRALSNARWIGVNLGVHTREY